MLMPQAQINHEQIVRLARVDDRSVLSLLPPPPVGCIDYRIKSVSQDWLRQAYRIEYEAVYPMGQLSFGL